MDINKDNYEEYFLLYADNELSQGEKNAVEDFIKKYPELEEELLMIKLSVSKPDDDCVLEDKNFLYKDASFINASNYQEVLMLYNDNELTDDERKETEAFLSKNLLAKNEFELLQNAKLEADNTIVFPNKKLLYKKETAGKIISIAWWKIAAAAMLLGAGIWSGVAYLQKNNHGAPVAVKNNAVENNPVKNEPVKNLPVQQQPHSDKRESELVNVVVKKKNPETQKQNFASKRNITRPIIQKQNTTDELPLVKNQTQPEDVPDRDVIKVPEEKEVQATSIKENIANIEPGDKTSRSNDLAVSEKQVESKYVKTSFALDENENNNNYAFYNIPQDKFNRSKFGGFLRKVKRIIERKISPFNSAKDKDEVVIN